MVIIPIVTVFYAWSERLRSFRKCQSGDLVKNGTNASGSSQYHCKAYGAYGVLERKATREIKERTHYKRLSRKMQYFPIKYVGCEHPNNNQTTHCIDKEFLFLPLMSLLPSNPDSRQLGFP